MTKSELSALLHKLNIPVGEGEQYLDSKDKLPKIAYWEYLWHDSMASGDDYDTLVTYQVSLVSSRPRDASLIKLKQMLNEIGLHPDINIEYVKGQNSPGQYHTYFALQVSEDIC